MRVLGIDPGTLSCGYGIVEEEDSRLFYVTSGGITVSSKIALPKRLKRIYDELEEIIKKHRPDGMAIENLFFAKNVQAALKLGQAKGVAILAAIKGGIPVFEYSPLEVKQSVVGHGTAEKKQVQHMVKTLLGLKTLPHPPDLADALALAICHIHAFRMKERLILQKDFQDRDR
jgi:crossover junction endodeoxyribonuclease RuvC